MVAPACMWREGGGVFTCRSQSLAELLADCILQVPDSRSRKLAEEPQVRWGLLSASAGVCLQDTNTQSIGFKHVTGLLYFNQSHSSDVKLS